MSDISQKKRTIFEAAQYLYAILLLVQNKQEGVKIIMQSSMNITRSFMAYFWCLPAQLFMWSLIWRRGEMNDEADRIDFLLTVSVIDLSAWLLFAAAIYVIMILTSAKKAAAPIILATNWFNLFGTYIFFVPATLSYALPLSEQTTAIMEVMVYVTIVCLYFRVIRHMLGNHKLFAFALTLANVVIGVFVSSFAYNVLSN